MELFKRDGTQYTGATGINAKGQHYYVAVRRCGRCGGAGGSDKWAYTGYVCYDCGGSGTNGTETIRLYDAERLAKLNATAAKRDATRAAKHAAKVAAEQILVDARRADWMAVHGALVERAKPFMARSEFINDVITRAVNKCAITDPQRNAVEAAIDRMVADDARRANARHLGQIGERITVTATVLHASDYGSRYTGHYYITVMRAECGSAVVVKSGSWYAEKGQTITVTGTVKSHDMYHDEPQTRLMRPRIEK